MSLLLLLPSTIITSCVHEPTTQFPPSWPRPQCPRHLHRHCWPHCHQRPSPPSSSSSPCRNVCLDYRNNWTRNRTGNRPRNRNTAAAAASGRCRRHIRPEIRIFGINRIDSRTEQSTANATNTFAASAVQITFAAHAQPAGRAQHQPRRRLPLVESVFRLHQLDTTHPMLPSAALASQQSTSAAAASASAKPVLINTQSIPSVRELQ